MKYSVGDKVVINAPDRVYNGHYGVIGTIDESDSSYTVEIEHENVRQWFEENELSLINKNKKGNDMAFTKTKAALNTAGTAIADETVDVAKINVGKIVYGNLRGVATQFMPKLKWYEKLFVSAEKRELAELLAVYGVLHLVKTKYSHYLIDAVTMYINMNLQTKLIGSIDIAELDNIFKLPKKV